MDKVFWQLYVMISVRSFPFEFTQWSLPFFMQQERFLFNSSGPEYFCSSFPFESVTLFLRQYQFNFIPGRSTPKRITGIQYCCFCTVNLSSFSTLVMSDSDRTEFLLFFNFKNITVLQLGVLEFLSSVKRTFFFGPKVRKEWAEVMGKPFFHLKNSKVTHKTT